MKNFNKNNLKNEDLRLNKPIEEMSDNELDDVIAKAKQQKQVIREKELEDRRIKARAKIDELIGMKEAILPLFNHSCSSCSDENPCNGWESDRERARCKKCLLIEILDNEWGDSFEVSLDIFVGKIPNQ